MCLGSGENSLWSRLFKLFTCEVEEMGGKEDQGRQQRKRAAANLCQNCGHVFQKLSKQAKILQSWLLSVGPNKTVPHLECSCWSDLEAEPPSYYISVCIRFLYMFNSCVLLLLLWTEVGKMGGGLRLWNDIYTIQIQAVHGKEPKIKLRMKQDQRESRSWWKNQLHLIYKHQLIHEYTILQT